MKLRRITSLAAVLLVTSCMQPPAGNLQTASISWHPLQEDSGRTGAVDAASAELVRYESGLSFQMRTEELTPGNAYTLWIIVINDPQACESSPCSASDILENTDTDSQVLFADGTVAGGSRGTLAGSISVGPLDGWLPDRSLRDPFTAEIQLVINDHGSAIPEMIPEMMETYRGGCSDESPFPPIFPQAALEDGDPGPNSCLLFQAATFPAP